LTAAPPRCRLGLIALGDSITNGNGNGILGVPGRSWALWLAQALELPYTNLASDGARAVDVARTQLPRVRRDYDVACLYVGVNDARSTEWDPDGFARDLAQALEVLSSHAERVLTMTLPLDLGRPRAGGVEEANAIITELATRFGAVCADLAAFRGARLVLPDAVHPTGLGQIAIADAAARALGAGGMTVPRMPSSLVEVDESARSRLGFASFYAVQLARDLVRRAVERVHPPEA